MAWDLDDDGWEDMPVVRSEPNPLGLDEEDQKKYHYKTPIKGPDGEAASTSNASGQKMVAEDDGEGRTFIGGENWRERADQDDSEYTRLRLEEDHDADKLHSQTQYLFDSTTSMTPLSQMQATKNLLTEAQRIAYVGLCKLATEEMVAELKEVRLADSKKAKGKGVELKGEAEESCSVWGLKIMARLFAHMELTREEQRMIESLAEHGVLASDLTPSLMATHTIANPEYDPAEAARVERERAQEAADQAEALRLEAELKATEQEETKDEDEEVEVEDIPFDSPPLKLVKRSLPSVSADRSDLAFGIDSPPGSSSPLPPSLSPPASPVPPPYSKRSISSSAPNLFGDDDEEDEGGDIGRFDSDEEELRATPKPPKIVLPEPEEAEEQPKIVGTTTDLEKPLRKEDENATPLLPGSSTTVTAADEDITLDIRWTILCDLFLLLIADSVYDARSRVLLERAAVKLSLGIIDVVRFEKRVTESLEIQEGVERMKQEEVIEGREQTSKKGRYVAIGLATLGGGLVIGLSAGLLAPVIGAALGGALTTVGITGTAGFLGGAGGAAVITTGGVAAGSTIATRSMKRRTQVVKTFELKALHNQKRVNAWITMPGFMNDKNDDVRLPFSTLDPIIGDVFTTFWEPEMMEEMGNALKILTTEVLSSVGQTVLQATVMTALISALQWPLILTKLSYLIDNPWSNALDRSRAAGLVLADTLLHRHVGVRPVSLIGYSLGARAIFYALAELARVKAYGIVQDVYLFGATITANKKTWLDVRSVVSGRFVNGYARSDWVLGYLFRATAAGNTVAGLRPVEGIPRLENVDITDKISGHLSYRPMMPLLLHTVGLPVTADYFDEPEEPEFMEDMERIVMTEEEEDARRAAKKRWFGLGRKSKPNSGLTTPNISRPPSFDHSGKAGGTPPAYDEDADDLPPRSSTSSNGPPILRADDDDKTPPASPAIVQSPDIPIDISGSQSPDSALPAKAGFDFAAISRALGKDIDVDALEAPPAGPQAANLPVIDVKPPLERSESTPPSLAEPSTSSDSPPSSPLASSFLHDLSRLSLDSAPASTSALPSSSLNEAWSAEPDLPPVPSISYDTNAWGSTPSSLYRSAPDSSSSALPSFSNLHRPLKGFSHHLPPPDEPSMFFGGSDGSISLNGSQAKTDDVDDPWSKPISTRPGLAAKGVLDNPWG